MNRFNNYIECAIKHIEGNVKIVFAHKSHNNNGTVFVIFTEDIEEFADGSSYHFAHISFVNDPKSRAVEYNAKIDVIYQKGKFPVVCIFNNYSHVVHIPRPKNTEKIKSQIPAPDDEWSVLFYL